MALADLEPAQPGYAYDNTYLPDGTMAQRYVGGGVLPMGYNTGSFNPDGSLAWASNASAGGPAVRFPVQTGPRPDANGNYPWNAARVAPPITSVPATKFNLASLFGGPMQGNPNAGPAMVSTMRSGAVQSQLNPAFANRAANTTAEQQSLKDYAAQVLGGQAKAQAAADQEINSIDKIYGSGGGSVEARLAQLNRQQQGAANIAAQQAASRVRRGINAQRAGGGSSSYLDRLMAQQIYGIGAQNAGNAAQQGRADLTWLTGQRNAAVGQRQNILNTLAQRGLAPVMAGQQIESGALGNLAHLANLDYGNNAYEHPEDAWRRRLDFLDYISPYATA